SDAVIAARPLRRAAIQPGAAIAGYLYLVCQPPMLEAGRIAMFRSSLAGPALAGVLAVCALTTALALWIITAVTRPLRDLSDTVARAQREGFDGTEPVAAETTHGGDEFARLRAGFG